MHLQNEKQFLNFRRMTMKTDCSDMEIFETDPGEQANELIYRCIPTHFTTLKSDTENAIALQMKKGGEGRSSFFECHC